jgi:peptidoglycan hydrolase CwlO-like protein
MEENHNNGKKYLPTNFFIPLYLLVFTILIAVVGWFNVAIGNQNNQIDKTRENVSAVQGDIKSINTNLGNISASISEIKESLKQKK